MRQDVHGGFEVGDGARELYYAGVGARRQPKALHGHVQEGVGFGRERAVFLHLPRLHLAVGVYLVLFKTLRLDASGRDDPFSDDLGRLAAQIRR